jgi:hypothetical protein
MAAYLVALLVLAAAAIAGGALALVAGWRAFDPVAPAAGLAALIGLASFGAVLPDAGAAVAVPPLLAVVAAAALLVRRRPGLPSPLAPLAIAGVVAALTALPFLAAGRVGILGVSLNNDTSTHLVWADGLRDGAVAALFPPSGGYPLGPHALIAAIAELTGAAPADAMTGLTIAVPVLLGWSALGAVELRWRMLGWVAAAVVATAYLVAAYYGQGAFKELLMALFVLSFAVAAE